MSWLDKKTIKEVKQQLKEEGTLEDTVYEYSIMTDDYIICPYCGAAFEEDFEAEYYYNEGSYTFECFECGKEFNLDVTVTSSYETSRRDC